MKHGDFTGLAENYSKYRPGYSAGVLDAILGFLRKSPAEASYADVGAGTGIWTRLVAERGFSSVTAIEPNDDMRDQGRQFPTDLEIDWRNGSGEETGLADASVDLLSMASSFHWVDFDKGTREFHRALKPGGVFVALWNPRLARDTPILKRIDDYLNELKPDMKRVSSGSSAFTEKLFQRLHQTELFSDVVYMEGRHSFWMDKEHYMGVWRSVNDIQVQLGAEKFEDFMAFIDKELDGPGGLDAIYMTRAWCARKG